MFRVDNKGSFKNTFKFLKKAESADIQHILHRYGREGVAALASATPVDSGLSASSWDYSITRSRSGFSLSWNNTNEVSGVPVVILLQYGHGTGTGGYVQGRDFINPAIRPVFERMARDIWKEVGGL